MSNKRPNIREQGDKRWVINLVKASRNSEGTMLDILSDVEAWLRHSLPHYRSSWRVKTKAGSVREYLRATYILLEEFFAELETEGIKIPRSGMKGGRVTTVEQLIEGL